MSGLVTRVETHVTTWSGRLTRDELNAILLAALRDKFGTPFSGVTLQIDLGQPRDHAFVLTQDHHWYRKRDPDLDGSEPS